MSPERPLHNRALFVFFEKIFGYLINEDIRSLRRQYRGRKELKRIREVEGGLRMRIFFFQPLEDLRKFLFGCHSPLIKKSINV